MNSMAQQAVPNGMGHSDPLRAQFARLLTVVVTMLSPSLVSIPILSPLSKTTAQEAAQGAYTD
jgi:hypothetical protein